MSDLDRFMQIKKKIASLRQKRDQAQGALDEVLRRLKEEFKCDSLEEAEGLSKELVKEATGLEEAYKADLVAFEEKWGDLLK